MTTGTDIWAVVEPYLAAEHLELDDLEVSGRGRGRVVKIVVDGEDVNVGRLADVSRGISRLLDHDTDLEGSYQLEVTSPGLERKLRRPGHFQKSIGREVVVKIAEGEGKRTIRGVIAEAGDDAFIVESESGNVDIPFEDVVTAKTVFRWEKAPKPGH